MVSRGCFAGLLGVLIVAGCGDGPRPPGQAVGGSAGSGGAPMSQGGTTIAEAGEAPIAGAPDGCACDDGFACTLDDCSSGACEHQPLHFNCPAGQYCSLETGCAAGDACATDEDCVRPDACVLATCDPSSKRCVFAFLDGDKDGAAPESCGGQDCNDADAAIGAVAGESCDGKDNDCDGEVDPAQGSGCETGKSCTNGTCACDAPTVGCANVNNACVDLQNDPAHCGSCTTVCDEDEVCSEGTCECAPGLNRCGSSCRDFQTDPVNCGACGKSCGNGECVDGGCACPAPTEDCGTGAVLSCKDTQGDVQHCGGCGERCLLAGACAAGACDTQLTWFKMYGAYSATRHMNGTHVAADAAGNLFIGFNGESSPTTEKPDGVVPLWSSASVIARFDAQGALVWVKPSTTLIGDVAVVGSDVWAVTLVTSSTPDVTIAGQAFAMRDGYQGYTALVKLSGTDGSVLDHFQLDHTVWNTANYPFLFHDQSQLWVGGNTIDLRLGDTIWTRPSSAYAAYIYPVGGQPLWIPGRMNTAGLDAAGKLVVSVDAPSNTPFSFGGETFSIGSFATQGVARYTQAFVHEASFLDEMSSGSRLAMGMAGFTLIDEYDSPFFQQYSDTGTVIKTVGDDITPFRPYTARAQGNRLYMIGNGSSGAATLFGRPISGGYTSMLLAFDASTLALTHAMGFDAEPYGAVGYGGVEDFVVVDGGAAAILAISWERGLSIGDSLVDAGSGYRGLALARVELTAP